MDVDDAEADAEGADCGTGVGATFAPRRAPQHRDSAHARDAAAPHRCDAAASRPAGLAGVVAAARPQPHKGALAQETMDELTAPPRPDEPHPQDEPRADADAPTGAAGGERTVPATKFLAEPAAAEAPPRLRPPTASAPTSSAAPRWPSCASCPARLWREVDKFEMRRPNYGSVQWLEPVDLRDGMLDRLASLVRFWEREVTVYPSGSDKPPVGQGAPEPPHRRAAAPSRPRPAAPRRPPRVLLAHPCPALAGLNTRCQISMESTWPRDRRTGEDLRDARSVQAFRTKLQDHANRIGARMLGYDGELGLWRFQVDHF